MKVKDLLKEINSCIEEYPDFLEWDVYTEQLTESDKEHKRKPSPPDSEDCITLEDVINAGYGQGWKSFKDGDDWEYFECAGWWTICPDEKIFTVNVNF